MTADVLDGKGFNTQPPEGGWAILQSQVFLIRRFQHTAARRRLEVQGLKRSKGVMFQHTAARRRLGVWY